MRIFVTGASGWIGVAELLEAGHGVGVFGLDPQGLQRLDESHGFSAS